MALRLDLRIDGTQFDDIQNLLARIREQIKDVRPLLKTVGAIYYESTMERFRSHTDPQGRSWKHLKPDTIRKKTTGLGGLRGGRQRRPPSIESPYNQLIWTGKMRSAIKVRFIDQNSIHVGLRTDQVPYAAVHQFGAPSDNIPQRKFLGATKRANDQVRAAMIEFVRKQVGG